MYQWQQHTLMDRSDDSQLVGRSRLVSVQCTADPADGTQLLVISNTTRLE